MFEHSTLGERLIEMGVGIIGIIGGTWAGVKYLLQPAYKLDAAEMRAEQYRLTADAYKDRIDSLVRQIEDLTAQVRAQIERADMALLYIAERLAWERRGRTGSAPVLAIDLEIALYDLVAQSIKHDREVSEVEHPFTVAPEEGAQQ